MRILWLGHNLAYPPKSGALQRNYNLLREAAKSYEVHVLAFDQPDTRPPGVTPEDCVRALREFCASVEWLPLSRGVVRTNRYWLALRGSASRTPFAMHWLQSLEMEKRLYRALEAFSFDLVHFDTIGLAQYKPAVKHSATVLNHHDVESSMIARRATNDPNVLRRLYWCTEARKLIVSEGHWCPQFTVNLVVSKEEEQLLKTSVPGVQTAVVANGVDTDYFFPRRDPGGMSLLFCGSLDLYPNHEAMKLFFRAIWPTLIGRLPSVQIYVIGRKPPRWLERLSSEDERIHVLGFVDDVRPYFRKATAYVCPIIDGGGTRLKILDALAMGMPLIATSFACSGLSLEGEKHVLLAETRDELVYQVERVLSDGPLRKKLAAAGRELVEREYSWSVIGKSLIGAYENACRAKCLL